MGRAYVGNFGFDLDTAEINGTLDKVLAAHHGSDRWLGSTPTGPCTPRPTG